jgi:putative ABC transport system substrate-binding protein
VVLGRGDKSHEATGIHQAYQQHCGRVAAGRTRAAGGDAHDRVPPEFDACRRDKPHGRAFRQGLKETGYVEGQNVATEYRFAENDRDKLTALVRDFIHRPVAVIVGNLVAALAAKAASTTVPIVFATGSDPVKDGLVTNLNRPGGNVTGVSFFASMLGAKRLEQLHQLVPSATTIGVLAMPGSSEEDLRDVEVAARTMGQQLIVLSATSAREIESAFATFAQR